MNHNIMLMQSIHTAFFIRLMPGWYASDAPMYILPKSPNSAAYRIKMAKSQAKTRATLSLDSRSIMMYTSAVTDEMDPTTVAKT